MGIIFCKCVCLNILFRFRGFFTPGEVMNASSLGILACYKYPGHGCINHCICLSKMSGKKQMSILSFAQREKPPKKARLGPEKVVYTLEEEMVEEEETVAYRWKRKRQYRWRRKRQCRWRRKRQCRWRRRRWCRWKRKRQYRWKKQWSRWLEQKGEKSQEQPPTRPLLIVNGQTAGTEVNKQSQKL